MTPLRVHVATLADLESVAALFNAYRQFYEQTDDLTLARRFIRHRMERAESVILVASTEGDAPLGFCQLYPTFCSVEARQIYTLSDLFVAPQARRASAGKALLRAAEQHAARAGMARMELTTARTNLRAQSLYESLGWARDEVFLAYNKRVDALALQ